MLLQETLIVIIVVVAIIKNSDKTLQGQFTHTVKVAKLSIAV